MRLIKIGALLVLLQAGLVSGAEDKSGPDERLQAEIESLITQRHPSDTSKSWRALGRRAPTVMMQLYASRETLFEKIRLLEALGWFKTPEVSQFLKQTYEKESNSVLKKAALRSIAQSDASSQKELLERELPKANVHEKLRIAKILDASGSQESTKIVDRFLVREPSAEVRSAILESRKLRSDP